MSKYKILNSAGITAAIGLASLPAFLTLAPLVAPNGVFADEPTANSSIGGPVALSINPALAITAEDISISATPTVGNTFITTTSTINVKNTGSSGGYHLIMSSENGGSLVNGSNSISTFSEYNKTGTDMKAAGNSSWGWTLQSVSGTNAKPVINDNGDILRTYNSIPISTTNWNMADDQDTSTYAYLKNTTKYTDMANGDDTVVGYGFAIGPDVPAGTYTDTIAYTAIPNNDNNTIFDLSAMQDLALYPEACANTPTPAVRTGSTPDTAVIVNTTSLASYALRQANIDKIPTKELTDTRNNEKYIIKKLADGHCWMTANLKIANVTIEEDKSNVTADMVGIDGFNLPTTVAATATQHATNVAYVSDSGTDNTYLYNWYAATAGTGMASMANQSAPGDICPKGWQLPNGIGDMSWDRLLSVGEGVYEIATSDEKFSAAMVAWGVANKDGRGINIASGNPLGLHTTGYFINNSFINGGNGYYWSRSATNSANTAYGLAWDGASLMVKSTWIPKYSGLALRCVSR